MRTFPQEEPEMKPRPDGAGENEKEMNFTRKGDYRDEK